MVCVLVSRNEVRDYGSAVFNILLLSMVWIQYLRPTNYSWDQNVVDTGSSLDRLRLTAAAVERQSYALRFKILSCLR